MLPGIVVATEVDKNLIYEQELNKRFSEIILLFRKLKPEAL